MDDNFPPLHIKRMKFQWFAFDVENDFRPSRVNWTEFQRFALGWRPFRKQIAENDNYVRLMWEGRKLLSLSKANHWNFTTCYLGK